MNEATRMSSRPTAIDAAGSGIDEPVTLPSTIPDRARPIPTSAAVSSNRTILTLGSRLWRT
jgi:hypothetical protein